MKKRNGFTLVELLVVVAIIAILSMIGITLFSSVQKNARDATRRADIDAIAKALESSRNPETQRYIQLSTGQFTANKIPSTDPQGYLYCGNNTINVPSQNVITGYAQMLATCPGGFDQVSASIPVVSGGTWIVCTYLESGKAYCKNSTQ